MANIKFRPTRKTVSFKNRASGLQIGQTKLQEQQERGTKALENLQRQQYRADQSKVSGLASKHRFEEGVLVAKNNLEKAATQHRYEALVKFAQTDVARLTGEADLIGKELEHLRDLVPKSAKAWGKLAEAGYNVAQELHGQSLWDAANKSGLIDKPASLVESEELKIKVNAINDLTAMPSEEFFEGWRSTFGSRNPAYGWRWHDHKKSNADRTKQEALAAISQMGGNYNKHNAVAFMDFFAWKELQRIGVSPYSQAGKQIIQMYRRFGSDDAHFKRGSDNAELTQTTLKGTTEDLFGQLGHRKVTVDGVERNETQAEYKARITPYFNAGVLAMKNGTYIGKDNKLLLPGIGPDSHGFDNASGFEAYLGYLAENHSDRFTVDEFRELAEGLNTVANVETKWVNGKAVRKAIPSKELWDIKHITRLDRAVENFSRIKSKKQQAKVDGEVASQNDINLAEFEASDSEFKDKEKNPDNYIGDKLNGKKYKLFMASWVQKANLWTGGNEISKNKIFELAGLGAGQYRDADAYSLIARTYYSDDPEAFKKAMAIYSGFSPEIQKRLAPEFEVFQKVSESGWSYDGSSGQKGITKWATKTYQKAEGAPGTGSTAKSLSRSGERNQVRYEAHVQTEYMKLINTPEFKDPSTWYNAMNVAIGIVDKEFADGAFTNKEKYPAAYNASRYRREPAGFGVNDDTQVIYLEDTETADALLVDKVIKLRSARADMSKQPEGDIPIAPFEPSTIETIYLNTELQGNKQDSFKYLMRHPRIIDSVELKRWINKPSGLFWKGAEPGRFDHYEEWPPGVKALAKVSGRTCSEIMTALAAQEGYNVHFSADTDDQLIIENGGKKVKPENVVGVHYFNACKAQGCYAKSHEAQDFLDNGSTALDQWQKANGVEIFRGDALYFNDPEKAIEGGVLWMNVDTPSNTLASLNLQPSTVL